MVFIVEHENEGQSLLESDGPLSEEVTIRDARPEDALGIHRVLRSSFEPLISRGYSRTAVRSAIAEPWRIRKRIISGMTVLVAEDGPDIIGTVTGIIERQTLQAVSLAVQPEYQRRGIGIKLLTALEYLAIDDDCHKIYVLTAWSMIEAARLYLRLGYVQEGYLRNHHHGEDLVIFSKHFSQEDDIQWRFSSPQYEAIHSSLPYWLF